MHFTKAFFPLMVFALAGCSLVGRTPGVGQPDPPAPVTLEPFQSATPARSTPAAAPTQTQLPDLAATITAGAAPHILGVYRAPDSSWEARIAANDCTFIPEYGEMAYEELRLTGELGSFVAESQLINCGGLGGAGLAGLFWSADSRYFYYTTAREGMPDGCIGYWKAPLSRLDLQTRSTQYLGIGETSPDGNLFAVWRDAYLLIGPIQGQGAELTIELPAPGDLLGALVWSPASDALAFIQAESYCPASGSSVYLLELGNPVPSLLLGPDNSFIAGVRWLDPGHVLLEGENGRNWVFDRVRDTWVTPQP